MEDRHEKIKKRKWFLVLVIGVLLLIPTIYSFVFLQAYWDPYGRMDQVPVAVVNEDEGKDGTNQGDVLTQGLIDQHALDLRVESADEAKADLNLGRVYATLTIPQNFTRDLMSAETTEKVQPKIVFSANQKANYVISQLLRMVSTEVRQKIDSEAAEKIVVSLSEKLREVPNQVQQINDGLTQLADGSGTLRNSYLQFDDGVKTLRSGADTLAAGLNQLNMGVKTLYDGMQTLQAGVAKMDALKSGVVQLKDGAQIYTTGVDGYTHFVGGAMEYVENYIKEFGKQLPVPIDIPIPNIGQIEHGICVIKGEDSKECQAVHQAVATLIAQTSVDVRTKTAAETATLVNQVLASGGSQINDGLGQLVTGTAELKTLQDGVAALADGTKTLTDGSQQATDGANALSTGAGALVDASGQVAGGIGQLDDGLHTAESKVSSSLSDTKVELKKLDGLPEFSADPVNVSEEPINPVDKYGVAFAPFFISLSLWVGAFTLFVVFYSDRNQRFKNCDVHAKNKFKRSCCYMAAAIAQGLILGVILKWSLGLTITNWGLYLGSLVLVSAMFEAIIEFLIVVFDDFGKFLALVLLIIQVAASGGTFPIEVVSGGFQWLYNLLPMRYSISLLKESTVSTNPDTLIPALTVIVSVTVVFVAGNIVAGILKTRYAKKHGLATV